MMPQAKRDPIRTILITYSIDKEFSVFSGILDVFCISVVFFLVCLIMPKTEIKFIMPRIFSAA